MKTQGNGNRELPQGAFTTQVIEDNPYLKGTLDHDETSDSSTERFEPRIEDEEGPAIEADDVQRRTKLRRRRLALAGLVFFLLASIVAALAIYTHTSTRVEYGTAERRGTPSLPSSTVSTGRDARTDKAIEEAKRLTFDPQSRPAESGQPRPQSSDSPVNSKTLLEMPFKAPSSSNEATNFNTDIRESNLQGGQGLQTNPPATSPSRDSAANQIGSSSQRNSEVSLYMNEPVSQSSTNQQLARSRESGHSDLLSIKKPESTTLPAFASMLPVRTVGALYTLRPGALVRFELTRETKGDGWSMKRGTILVGTSKGGEFDRAFVGLIGFIDPQTGKLVKLGGDLLGGDGAAGLKGKRRQLDGGWTRALGVLSNAALGVTGALLSGGADNTVIVSDGFRTRATNPLTDEIRGALGNEFERRQGRSFVEVLAGTPGYVLVTDLPSSIKGTEPIPDPNSDTLAELSDVDAIRRATGLSERQLADLLSSGSPELIRAAMPRMSPEMRKIAALVLQP